MNTTELLNRYSPLPALHGDLAGDVDLSQFSQLLAHTERLATLGVLAAGVAHELNNPVSVIISTTHAMRADIQGGSLSPTQLDDFLNILEENAWRCARMVQSLRGFSHQQATLRTATRPQKIIEQAVALVRHQFRDRNLTLQMELPAVLPAVVWDENQIEQVLVNLLLNACDATAGDNMESAILVSAVYHAQQHEISLSVADNGPGVPPDLNRRIFEPFFTTKPLGEGTGLGLYIAAGIVRQHGGSIQVSNRPEGGACFTVRLPVEPAPRNGDKL